MQRTLRRTGVGAAICVGALAASTASADQEYSWAHTWTYVMGPMFDDFHATYTGTGGTIDREVLTMDTAGGGVITGDMNMIHIVWPDTWVDDGDMFRYTFNTAFPEIAFNSGSITKGGIVIGVFGSDGVVRDPATQQTIGQFQQTFVPAPGAIALLLVGGAVARRRRNA